MNNIDNSLDNINENINENKHIYPRRMTMIQMGNNCMFCENPQGDSYMKYVSLEDKMGYIFCKECRDNGNVDKNMDIWNNHLSYGKAHYLKGRDIKIERSPRPGDTNGFIESGWKLNNPVTSINCNFDEVIHCYNEELDLGKWCLIETIMKLNPKNEIES